MNGVCFTIFKIKLVPKIQLRKMDYCYERKCCLFHLTPKSFVTTYLWKKSLYRECNFSNVFSFLVDQ